MSYIHRHLAFLLLGGAACVSTPASLPDATPDIHVETDIGPVHFGVGEAHAYDANGEWWPPDGTPWLPEFRVTLPGAPEDWEGEVWLFSDVRQTTIADDLARAPIRVANLARSVPLRTRWESQGVRVVPDAPLQPGRYVLALRGDAPFVGPWTEEFVVAENGGARLENTWPPSEATAVPAGVSRLYVRFGGGVHGELQLHGPGGGVGFTSAATSCEEFGWPAGDCRRLDLDGPLQRGSRYTFDSRSMTDRTGRSLTQRMSFHTVTRASAALVPVVCEDDEVALSWGCALLDDESLTLRARFDAPIRARLESPWETVRTVSVHGELAVELRPIPADTEFGIALHLVDLAGDERSLVAMLSTLPRLPDVFISEVRCDPFGREPQQEYVELFNATDEAVDLSAWRLSDAVDREGDALSGSIPSRGRLLVVASAFDPLGAEDVPVPAGTPLVRIGTSIASGGLSNSGEPLFLRTPDGQRIASFPARPSPGEGDCWRAVTNTRAPNVEPGPCRPGSE
ncbi:MAG: lamin tail domain-containing protein [Polyangiales bacterium]